MKIIFFLIFWCEFRQNLSKNDKISKKSQFFGILPFSIQPKYSITGFALYFLKHVEISLVTSLYFLRVIDTINPFILFPVKFYVKWTQTSHFNFSWKMIIKPQIPSGSIMTIQKKKKKKKFSIKPGRNLDVRPSVCLSVCLSVRQTDCPSVFPSVRHALRSFFEKSPRYMGHARFFQYRLILQF